MNLPPTQWVDTPKHGRNSRSTSPVPIGDFRPARFQVFCRRWRARGHPLELHRHRPDGIHWSVRNAYANTDGQGYSDAQTYAYAAVIPDSEASPYSAAAPVVVVSHSFAKKRRQSILRSTFP